ncbi:MAG: ComEC/Rec2 family competence protein, partial [Planctomycetota bacterium]
MRTRCTIGLTVAVVAWLIAAPIAAAGIGVVSTFGVLATIIVTPTVTVMLWLGYTALALGVLIPSSAALLAPLIAGATAATTWVVRTVDRVPGAFTQAPPVSAWWAAGAVVVAALAMGGARRLIWIPAFAVVIAWGGCEWLVRRDAGDALRVDMLAVGDGSAILLRSGNDAMLWDCGSMSSDLGMRTIPAACSALGATSVGRAIITHADFDHFSALPDTAQRLGIRSVYVGPTIIEQAAMPTTASAVLIDQLTQMGVEILPLSQGDSLTVGAATLRVIAPGPGLDDEADNDRALAALVE